MHVHFIAEAATLCKRVYRVHLNDFRSVVRNCLIMAVHNDGERSCNLDHVDVQCQVEPDVFRTLPYPAYDELTELCMTYVNQLQDDEAQADEEDMLQLGSGRQGGARGGKHQVPRRTAEAHKAESGL